MINLDESVQILLIEDDYIYQEAIARALQKARIASPLTVAGDGIEALRLLRGDSGLAPIAKRCIILLDLHMPRMSGLEFLTELRADPKLESSVVFILSSSRQDAEVVRAYELKVAGFITKPTAAADFALLMQLLSAYWKLLALPARDDVLLD